MMKLPIVMLATSIGVAPLVALACGACIEDKIAATYDYAVVTAAAAKGDRVVFGAIDGPVETSRVTDRIRATASKIRGVHRETVQTSLAPAAFSFVLDRGAAPESAVAELERRLAVPGVRLTVIRVQ